jgi:ketosteroid isomerase-like protein
MGFREALRRHLQAIQERDLQALADTVAPEALVLVMADGRLARRTAEFLEAHRGWFAMPDWTLEAREVQVFEGAGLGVAVLELDYREPPAVHSRSYLTLAFQRHGERWLMVLDQNTPIK